MSATLVADAQARGLHLALRDTAATTREIPRPTPGSMPEPRSHGAVWSCWGPHYTLQRGTTVLARVTLVGDILTRHPTPARVCEAHHIDADVAAVTAWISRGGR